MPRLLGGVKVYGCWVALWEEARSGMLVTVFKK